MEKIKFARDDGYNPSVDYSNPIQEKWIHKQVVKITGDGEDDFIIEEKPVLVDKVDLKKRINEEAKTTDLKYLLKQLLMTGDESVLNVRNGVYCDISGFPDDKSLNAVSNVSENLAQIKAKLPDDFKKLSDEELLGLSEEDIVSYFEKYKAFVEGQKVNEGESEVK